MFSLCRDNTKVFSVKYILSFVQFVALTYHISLYNKTRLIPDMLWLHHWVMTSHVVTSGHMWSHDHTMVSHVVT